jgi:hypothetical protein
MGFLDLVTDKRVINERYRCAVTSRGRQRLAPPILYLGARRWWLDSAKPRPLYLEKKNPVAILHKPGWVMSFGASLDWPGKLDPNGFRSPDIPARVVWLYRLSYLGPCTYK